MAGDSFQSEAPHHPEHGVGIEAVAVSAQCLTLKMLTGRSGASRPMAIRWVGEASGALASAMRRPRRRLFMVVSKAVSTDPVRDGAASPHRFLTHRLVIDMGGRCAPLLTGDEEVAGFAHHRSMIRLDDFVRTFGISAPRID